jgi:hypothetical protein
MRPVGTRPVTFVGAIEGGFRLLIQPIDYFLIVWLTCGGETCVDPKRRRTSLYSGPMRTLVPVIVAALACGALQAGTPIHAHQMGVTVCRVPDAGIQPQAAVDEHGAVHLVYFRGEPAHGDAFYIYSRYGWSGFSKPIQVNSVHGSVMATGTVRGAQVAVGRNRRVHVAWNGAQSTAPGATPMFYTRLNAAGTAFEPQRNVMHAAYDIDGGGAVTADHDGHVYVAWHANAPGEREEARRRVWVARSRDDGQTFDHERPVFDEPTGACGCCGLGAFADSRGSVFVLFRSAFEVVHRDMFLLMSHDSAESFVGTKVDQWNVGACVMSTQAFAQGASAVYAAWETEGQVYVGRIDLSTGALTRVLGAPGVDRTKKHPALAVNLAGDVLLAWTEGTAWNKGGVAVWQVFDSSGTPIGEPGRADGLPVWGLVAAYAQPDRGFSIAY